jgi:hypothetical protein
MDAIIVVVKLSQYHEGNSFLLIYNYISLIKWPSNQIKVAYLLLNILFDINMTMILSFIIHIERFSNSKVGFGVKVPKLM